MGEWVRFWLTAAVLIAGLGFLAAGVIGNCRFYYVMNRIHAAGLGDTMGLLLTVLALAVSEDTVSGALRLFLPLVFLWLTSPVASHFLSMIEYYTNRRLYRHMERESVDSARGVSPAVGGEKQKSSPGAFSGPSLAEEGKHRPAEQKGRTEDGQG